MNQTSVTPSQDVIKSPTTLDKIPEDVQLAIIKCIQSWKKSEGTEQEREKGKRSRDSALRSVAVSCRNLLSIYRPELLSDVTLNRHSLLKFYLVLARTPDSGKLVRSITYTGQDVDLTPEDGAEVRKDLVEVNKELRAQGIKSDHTNTLKYLVEAVYQLLPNIQTLVIRKPGFGFPLQSDLSNARLAPLPFLTHSLKKLSMHKWPDSESNLKARNVVWILVFCNGLRSACLGCIFDQNDFKYLTELSDTFSGLSKVLKLALVVEFSGNESIERYWDRGVGNQWIGGNKKTEAVFNLLKVTKNLQCLEINHINSVAQRVLVNPSCLSALQSPYSSLESTRLLGMTVDRDDPEERKASTVSSLFQRLKVMYLDAAMLLVLSRFPDVKLPPGLKVLCITFYYGEPSIQEDLELVSLLKVGSLTALEAVVVPSKPIRSNGAVTASEGFKRRWLEGRRELEKAEVVASGKVELRLIDPGESIGESSETDFMSSLTWLSPP